MSVEKKSEEHQVMMVVGEPTEYTQYLYWMDDIID